MTRISPAGAKTETQRFSESEKKIQEFLDMAEKSKTSISIDFSEIKIFYYKKIRFVIRDRNRYVDPICATELKY